MESDESVNNFDPEFTSADISNMSAADALDEDDPSEAWVSRSISQNGFVHTPNGPLGSERLSTSSMNQHGGFGLGPLSTINGNGTTATTNGHNGNSSSTTAPKGIQIKTNKKKDAAGSPLTNSVQENFKGFTYSGESFVIPPGVLTHYKQKGDEVVDGEEEPEVTTEDEVEDTRVSAGRYANMRRKGLGFSSLDDDFMS